ncbi:MAG: PDZ domain-containing protein [Planctomycetaceae bacterium]|nr:PDZ domain-containing protein [Planctomycetaceae bacterium]
MTRVFLIFHSLLFACCSSGLSLAEEPLSIPEQVVAAQQRRIDAIKRASESTISVFSAGKAGGGGSGVVITSDGFALTNFHVSKPCGEHMKCSMNNGELYDAVIVGIDPTGDVALIKLLGREDFPAAEMGDSDLVRVGQWCFAVGNPFLLATNFQPTVTYGIVSGVHRYQYPAGTLLEYADCIQTDAAINPGNSGGPLFNEQGQLIGINGRGSFEKRKRVNVGVGYAISMNQIKHFLGHLNSGRIVDHATLGANVATDEDGSVVVTNILESSDAYRRGLRYGDHIIAFGGRPIDTVNGLKNALGIFPKGWRVPLSYRRDGERFDVQVRLAGVHGTGELIAKVQSNPASSPIPMPKRPDQKEPDEEKEGQRPALPKLELPELPLGKKIPAAVESVLKTRRGYANYHFNEANRDRVWTALRTQSDFFDTQSTWKLRGQVADQASMQITLDDNQTLAQISTGQGDTDLLIDMTQDLEAQLEPAGSGGMLVALHLWRYLMVNGPNKFGEVYYLGKAPWPGQSEPADVLVGTHDAIEAWFYFSPESGQLVGMEMYPDTGVDPCELDFRDYREIDGQAVPFEINIRFGDVQFGLLKLDQFQVIPKPEKDA